MALKGVVTQYCVNCFFTEVSADHLFPRSIFELWGHGKSPEELYSSLRKYPVEKMVRSEVWLHVVCLQTL